MLRVILVDDEAHAIRGLRQLLPDYPDVMVVGTAESLGEARVLIADQKPDLVFLDVALTDGLGFDLLKDTAASPLVVLVTGCPSHAIRAFEVGALDYLLKPVQPKRLAVTMERVRNVAARQGPRRIAGAGEVEANRLLVHEGSDTTIVPFDMIGLLDADGDFTRILRTDGRDHLVCRRLGQFEDRLPTPPFMRVGRSCILNLDHMVRIEGQGSDGSQVHLRGVRYPVSLGRAATQKLKKAIAHLRIG
ncbi:LytR/AlgR family response regulator transcription factor [Chachezhania sediminis]|uniref:LytR/AlgR family response regulator transcription factor n=1 Tax=Chachezhania sediminis TaxID=2599291 RepID=UPI00131D4EE7|nr:LytTR family DNA-binding domain-containing protein [Chachezhania sediminis]